MCFILDDPSVVNECVFPLAFLLLICYHFLKYVSVSAV